ncbi:MAG: hypothetical protein KF858_14360 [Candidatus Sumerlaeia bacterium]|nr:hypothetical protein [Candidatus Sumerlaeia bacterium]
MTLPHPEQPRSSDSRERLFDMEVLLSIFFAARGTILLALVATVVATAVVSFVAPRRYEATVKLLAEPRREANPYALEFRTPQDRRLFVETQKELLVSDSVLARTVASSTRVEPAAVRQADIDRLASAIAINTRSSLGRRFARGEGIGESSTLFVTVQDSTPERAASTANTLVETYMDVSAELRLAQARSATRSLRTATEETGRQVQQAHRLLAEFESNAGPLLSELLNVDKPQVSVFPELENLRAEHEAGVIELARLRQGVLALEAAATKAADEGLAGIPTEYQSSNPLLRALAETRLAIQTRMNTLLPYYLDESREIASLREEIALTNREFVSQVSLLVDSERASMEVLQATQTAREAALSRYEQRLAQLSRMNSEYQELKRDYQAKAKALESQLGALAEAEAAAAQSSTAGGNITIVDAARPNPAAASPKVLRNILVAIPTGFLLGVLLVLIGQLNRGVFVHPREVERRTGLPVVGIANQEVAP